MSFFLQEYEEVEIIVCQFLFGGKVDVFEFYVDVIDELEFFGFFLCLFFDLLDRQFFIDIIFQLVCLGELEGWIVWVLGYYVCKKDVCISKGKLMVFGCWIGQDGYFFDIVYFLFIFK